MTAIAGALRRVNDEIAAAARRAGRSPGEVALVAVSKTQPVAAIRDAVAAGQRMFGENRVQEAVGKYKELGASVRWHFIGRLQRNKIRHLIGWVELFHSVDRIELAVEIDHRAQVPVEVLIEVNTSGEPTKGGISPAGLLPLLEDVALLPRVQVVGLMGMAPVVHHPEEARGYFRQLAGLAERARREFPELAMRELSMGMSQDYAIAVEEGATLVRVGEAVFGHRRPPTGGGQPIVADIVPATELRGR